MKVIITGGGGFLGNQIAHALQKRGKLTNSAGEEQPIDQLVIRPGETIEARVRAVRHDHKDRINFGGDDSGRNFAHGVYVDNIGLNGLMIPEGKTEQRFFITAAKWVQPSERMVHLRIQQGAESTQPVLLRVVGQKLAQGN